MTRGDGPGVPEALPRALRMIGERLGAGSVDRIWIFPPLVRGRREWGLVAASRFDAGSRRLFTAPYVAERTGRALHLDLSLREQGTAPADRLPRVMDGVVQRGDDELGEPEEIEFGGDAERFEAFVAEYDQALFEEEAQPMEKPKS